MAKFNPDDYENIRDYTSEIQNNMKEMAEHSDAIDSLFKSIGDTSNIMGRQIAKVQEKIKNDLKETTTSSEGYAKIQSSIEDILTNHKNLSQDTKRNLFEQLNKAKEYYDVMGKTEEAEKKRNDLVKRMTDSADTLIEDLKSQVKSIPVVGKLLSKALNFDKVKSEFKDKIVGGFEKGYKTAIDSGKGMTGALQAGLKGAIGGMSGFISAAKAALGPIMLVVGAIYLIKKAFDFNKETTQLAKDLGISVGEARDMEQSFNNISASSSNLNVNTKSLVEAQKQLSSATGLTAEFSEQMLTDQIQLTKFMGLSGDEAANFQKIAISNGQTAREMQGEIAGSVEQFNNATGASVSLKDVVQDIAKLPTDIRAGFKGTTAELAKTISLAKAMGTTLEKSVAAGKATLDIETSLKNEAQARILTGVSINNNAIRAAQLAGNQAEVLRLQKEEMKKIGDIGDYLPYQQEALAAAMGMSTSELVEQSEQMKLLEKVGGDLSKATLDEIKNNSDLTDEQKEQLIKQKEQVSAQEKLSEIGTKFKDMLNSIVAGPLGQMVGMVVDILVPAFKVLQFILTPIFKTLQFILTPITMIANLISTVINDGVGGLVEKFNELGPIAKGIATTIGIIATAFVISILPSVITMGATLLATILPALITGVASVITFAAGLVTAAISAISLASAATLGIGALAIAGGIAVTAAAMNSESDAAVSETESIDDGIVKPDGSVVKTNPADYIMAMKNPMDFISNIPNPLDVVGGALDGIGNLFGGGSDSNPDLLNEIKGLRSDIQAQPIVITVDGKVVSEITRVQSKQSSFRK